MHTVWSLGRPSVIRCHGQPLPRARCVSLRQGLEPEGLATQVVRTPDPPLPACDVICGGGEGNAC